MPTTATRCAPIRPSKWRSVASPRAAPSSAPSRPCAGSSTRPDPAAGSPERPPVVPLERRAPKRMMAAMVELFCDSFDDVPRRIVLDIDDTEDRVHGGQQLALFHAHYDSTCSLPIHIYEATTGKPVAGLLRPGKKRAVGTA